MPVEFTCQPCRRESASRLAATALWWTEIGGIIPTSGDGPSRVLVEK